MNRQIEKSLDDELVGMPSRAGYNIKKTLYDDNAYLDFDLYNKKTYNPNIDSFDKHSDSGAFANIDSSMEKITTQHNPSDVCGKGIEQSNLLLFYELKNNLNTHYLINSLGLYTFFGLLYASSRSTTEIELKKYFSFPQKELCVKGITDIYKVLDEIRSIRHNNIIIMSDQIPYSEKFIKIMKPLCYFMRINIDQTISEAEKLNTIISGLCDGIQMRNPIVPENLEKLQMMFLNTTTINPVWTRRFDKISKGMFDNQKSEIPTKYLHSISKNYGYFEDGSYQVLEIGCDKNKMMMGIILPKTEAMPPIDTIKLHFYISNMKECVLDEVMIPCFVKDCKIRFNNLLKKTGLQTVFMNIISPLFLPEGCQIHDIVQNIKIIIDTNSSKKENTDIHGYRTMRKFIANHPFIYYFRLVETNTVIFVGYYE